MKVVPRRTVLIVALSIDGHRQNYVAVLGRWFAEQGYFVAIACGPGDDGYSASQTPILRQFLAKLGAYAYDLEQDIIQNPTRFRERISQLETKLNPLWTLFADVGTLARRLKDEWPHDSIKRHRAAIFISFPLEYPLDLRPYSGSGIKTIEKAYRFVRHIYQRFQGRHFLKHQVLKIFGLEFILATDENAVAALSLPHIRYLPEIYRAWGTDIGPELPEISRARKAYAGFMNTHARKDVLLYYGGWLIRRGYDTLLEIAAEYQDTVFVSVGREYRGQQLPVSAIEARQKLVAQDRLFELNLPFLPENAFVDDLFRSARYVVLPYRHFYQLSGSLFQAVSYGCPVLVPDIGHMGITVCHYGAGLTYRHLDPNHLRHQFEELRRDPSKFKENALRLSERVGEKAIFAALAESFGGK
jgi:glycosyltransferase involved in cell wall biosynthesis